MRTMDEDLTMPGQPHPAVAHYLPALRSFKDRDVVLIPIERPVRWKAEEWADPVAATLNTHTFHRRKGWQSFYPDLGAWMWTIWTDELGRSVADDAEWVDAPDALIREPFNPVKAVVHPAERQGRFNRSCPACGLSMDDGFIDSNGGDHWTMHRV